MRLFRRSVPGEKLLVLVFVEVGEVRTLRGLVRAHLTIHVLFSILVLPTLAHQRLQLIKSNAPSGGKPLPFFVHVLLQFFGCLTLQIRIVLQGILGFGLSFSTVVLILARVVGVYRQLL